MQIRKYVNTWYSIVAPHILGLLQQHRERCLRDVDRSRSSCTMDSVLSLNGGDLEVPLIDREDDEEFGRPNEATAAPVTSSNKLGFGALVFLIYYNIGVPFGDEEVCIRT